MCCCYLYLFWQGDTWIDWHLLLRCVPVPKVLEPYLSTHHPSAYVGATPCGFFNVNYCIQLSPNVLVVQPSRFVLLSLSFGLLSFLRALDVFALPPAGLVSSQLGEAASRGAPGRSGAGHLGKRGEDRQGRQTRGRRGGKLVLWPTFLGRVCSCSSTSRSTSCGFAFTILQRFLTRSNSFRCYSSCRFAFTI